MRSWDDPTEHEAERRVQQRADPQRGQDADRQVLLRMATLLCGVADRVELQGGVWTRLTI